MVEDYVSIFEKILGKNLKKPDFNQFCDYLQSPGIFNQGCRGENQIFLKCVSMEKISDDSYLIDFEFPNPNWTSGIWPGGHMNLIINGMSRPYNPISPLN